jgi:hypothetical protein
MVGITASTLSKPIVAPSAATDGRRATRQAQIAQAKIVSDGAPVERDGRPIAVNGVPWAVIVMAHDPVSEIRRVRQALSFLAASTFPRREGRLR